jgi:hypothetical protein
MVCTLYREIAKNVVVAAPLSFALSLARTPGERVMLRTNSTSNLCKRFTQRAQRPALCIKLRRAQSIFGWMVMVLPDFCIPNFVRRGFICAS